jgi:acyl carrier protein
MSGKAATVQAEEGQLTERILSWLVRQVAEQTGVEPSSIDIQAPVWKLGLDSLAAVSLSGDLGAWLGVELPAELLWEQPTLEALASYAAGLAPGAQGRR